MNSIQPNIPTPPPQAQPGQMKIDAGDSAAAAPSKAFAAVMDHAYPKPAKKAAAGKIAIGDARGKPLPVAGNQAPLAAAVAEQTTPGKAMLLTVADSTATSAQPVAANSTPPAPSGPAASPASTPDDADTVEGDDMAVGGDFAVGEDTAATTAAASPAKADALPGPAAAEPDSPTGAVVSQGDSLQPVGAQSSAVQSAANGDGLAEAVVAQPGAAQASAVQASAVQASGAKPGLAAATASIAVAAKPPVGSITGNAPVATVKSDVVGTDGANPATTTTIARSDAGSVQTGADAGATAMAAATSGVATKNSVSSTDSAASAATGTPIGADAATVADATASATAAVAASVARVITQLASTTATDKRSRGADAVSGAASTAGSDGTSNAAQAMSEMSSTSSTEVVASPVFKVGPGVDSSEFGQSVANQVATMLGSNISSAKLSVNPPSLGPIEVRIAVQGDQAQISMMSHSAVTRDALHDSSPKLREMLNSQGFAQVSVDISQRSFQERTPTPQTYDWNSGTDRSDHSSATTAASTVARSASGTLDAYA